MSSYSWLTTNTQHKLRRQRRYNGCSTVHIPHRVGWSCQSVKQSPRLNPIYVNKAQRYQLIHKLLYSQPPVTIIIHRIAQAFQILVIDCGPDCYLIRVGYAPPPTHLPFINQKEVMYSESVQISVKSAFPTHLDLSRPQTFNVISCFSS